MRSLLPALPLCLFAMGCGAPPPATDGGLDARVDAADASGDVVVADRPEAPPVNVRCDQLYGTTVCEGTYVPTQINPAVREVRTGIGGTGAVARHYYCYPVGVASNDKLLLYIVGTTDNPATFTEMPRRACALGFASLSLAYHNEVDSRTACGPDATCYENFRREIVYGMDLLPNPINVTQTDSLLGRFVHVLGVLAEREPYFPAWASIRQRVTARDFSNVVVAGHSQGAGHALLIARDFAVDRLVMLAGVTDRTNSGTNNHGPAAWISGWSPAMAQTPSSRFFGYMHDDDGVAVVRQVLANWDALRLPAQECPWQAEGNYPAGCRRVRIPPARCGGGEAHNAVMLGAFGSATNACVQGGTQSRNDGTFRYLLTTRAE